MSYYEKYELVSRSPDVNIIHGYSKLCVTFPASTVDLVTAGAAALQSELDTEKGKVAGLNRKVRELGEENTSLTKSNNKKDEDPADALRTITGLNVKAEAGKKALADLNTSRARCRELEADMKDLKKRMKDAKALLDS
ncbi:hypothetical protein CF327_g4532 [Tilletia walkeri]|nr:hypothetical protein CF327_g4532 [Tilletia walkeri]